MATIFPTKIVSPDFIRDRTGTKNEDGENGGTQHKVQDAPDAILSHYMPHNAKTGAM
jgi:hypothetical protein